MTRLACARMSDIVRTLRTFARLDEADVKSVDLHEGIESTLVLIAHLTKSGITVERRYGDLPARRVPSEPDQPGPHEPVRERVPGDGRAGHADDHHARVRRWRRGARQGHRRRHRARQARGSIFDPGFTTKGAPLRHRPRAVDRLSDRRRARRRDRGGERAGPRHRVHRAAAGDHVRGAGDSTPDQQRPTASAGGQRRSAGAQRR